MDSNHSTTVVIPLTQGKFALIDEIDADRVAMLRWHFTPRGRELGYASHNLLAEPGVRRQTYMHRYILGDALPRGMVVDHINHDGLDNRRSNLRVVTASQNMLNRRSWKRPTSLQGVTASGDRWIAKIGHGGRRHYLGTYRTQEEAIAAYNAAKTAISLMESACNRV